MVQNNQLAKRYNNVAITLHWLTVIILITQFYTGWLFSDMERGPERDLWFAWHRTIGFTVLFLSLARLAWRFINPPPSLPLALPRWERTLAKTSHILFYVLLIALPLTGWIYVSSGSTAANTGITTLVGGTPWPIIPGLPRELHGLSVKVHVVLVYTTFALILLHIGAALKHQFIDKSRVANRMPPFGVSDKNS
jgi:cytochrome b561